MNQIWLVESTCKIRPDGIWHMQDGWSTSKRKARKRFSGVDRKVWKFRVVPFDRRAGK